MIVLDTHAWIWWAAEPRRLSAKARGAIEQARSIGVASISAWELCMLHDRGRLALDRPPAAWAAQALGLERVVELPLSSAVAVAAAALHRDETFPSDPADGMIYASARSHDARLISRDEGLRAFDPERVIW